MALNPKLLEDNYLLIENFIEKETALSLYKEFNKFCSGLLYNMPGDSQAPNSPFIYNYLPFLEILVDKIPTIKEQCHETVFPTYCYGRVYQKQEELKIHTDREACEISASLHLWGDKAWPFCIKTGQGETRELWLEPGQAVIYLGCRAEHWRPKFSGEKYGQVFLHYVRSRGPNSWAVFDKRKRF